MTPLCYDAPFVSADYVLKAMAPTTGSKPRKAYINHRETGEGLLVEFSANAQDRHSLFVQDPFDEASGKRTDRSALLVSKDPTQHARCELVRTIEKFANDTAAENPSAYFNNQNTRPDQVRGKMSSCTFNQDKYETPSLRIKLRETTEVLIARGVDTNNDILVEATDCVDPDGQVKAKRGTFDDIQNGESCIVQAQATMWTMNGGKHGITLDALKVIVFPKTNCKKVDDYTFGFEDDTDDL